MTVTIHHAGEEPAPKAAPSVRDQIIAEANRIEYETDAAGRRIGVRKLNLLDLHRLTKVMGEHASNSTALLQAMAVASIVDIDGDPVRLPSSEAQLEALMLRADFHGLDAAQTALKRLSPAREAIDSAKN